MSKSLARENTRTINEIGSQEESENTRITNEIGKQEGSEITRLRRSLLRPTKGSSAPNQKEGTDPLRRTNGEEHGPNPKGVAGPKSCQRRRTQPQTKRRGRFSQSNGG